MTTDIQITNHGSVAIVDGVSPAGRAWLAANLDPDAPRWGRDGYVVGPRYVGAIVDGACADGLVVA